MENKKNNLKDFLFMIVRPHLLLRLLKIKNLDENYHKVLKNDRFVRIFCFLLAIIFVISMRYAPRETPNVADVWPAQPLNVLINEGYTHFGSLIPETVMVFLSGDPSQIQLMNSRGDFEVYIDLTDLEVGTHDVMIHYTGATSQVSVRLEPGIILGVELAAIETREMPFEIAITNKPILDIRYMMETTTELETVLLSGPEVLTDAVVIVRAIADATDITETTIVDAFFMAYNLQGEVVDVDIYPATIAVELIISENIRTIPVEVSLTGMVATGRRIENMTITPEEIEIWGDFDALEEEMISLTVHMNEFNEDGVAEINLNLPEGVYSYTEVIVIEGTMIETEPTTHYKKESVEIFI